MALQIDDLGFSRELFVPGSALDLHVTGLLEEDLEIRSEADGGPALGKQKSAPEALVPSGLFPGDDVPGFKPSALVILSGRVLRSEIRTNKETGGTFVHAVVKTYAATVDVVAPREAALDGLREGRIVSGSFWVVAHPARSPYPPRRGRWPWKRAVR